MMLSLWKMWVSAGMGGIGALLVTSSCSDSQNIDIPGILTIVLSDDHGSGNVTSNPPGIDCGTGDRCSAEYALGTSVELTVTPDPDFDFTEWAGDCQGGNVTTTVIMDADKACIANFGPPRQFTLTVTKIGSGTGTVTSSPAGINCGDDCSEAYTRANARGTEVELTAVPDAGSMFVRWSGACFGGSESNQTRVVVDTDKTCTAQFDLNPIPTITITGFLQLPSPVTGAALPLPSSGPQHQNTIVTVGGGESGEINLVDIPSRTLLLGSGAPVSNPNRVFFAPHPSGGPIPYFYITRSLDFQVEANTIPPGPPTVLDFDFLPLGGAHIEGTPNLGLTDFLGGRWVTVDPEGDIITALPLATEQTCPANVLMQGNVAAVVAEEGFPGILDCTNQTGLFFLDVPGNRVTGRVSVGLAPRRVVASPNDPQRLFVSGHAEDLLYVVNRSTLAVERTVSVGDGPVGMAFIPPDGAYQLVVNQNINQLQMIDPNTGEVITQVPTGGTNPTDVFIAPDGRTGIVVNQGDEEQNQGGGLGFFTIIR